LQAKTPNNHIELITPTQRTKAAKKKRRYRENRTKNKQNDTLNPEGVKRKNFNPNSLEREQRGVQNVSYSFF